MRAAPAVEVAASPPALARHAMAGLAALAAWSLAAWVTGHLGTFQDWSWLALLPGGACGYRLGPRHPATLAWDGQCWHCEGRPGRLAVQLDFQHALLLRWTPQDGGRARWLLPHRRGVGGRWHALRVALFAGQPQPAVDAAGQPPLTP